MRSPRICFNALFLQDHLGGIGNYTFHLLGHIKALRPDWDLTLLVHKGVAPCFRPLAGKVRILEVGLRARAAKLLYFHILFPFLARRFDLLHSVGNMGLVFCPIPQVITLHDTYEQVSPERFGPAKRILMGLLISTSGRAARRIIAGSRNTLKDIGRFYPHLSAKSAVVHYGNKFPSRASAPASGRKDFIFVGTLEPGKNLGQVLEAYAAFKGKDGHRLLVVGASGWGHGSIPGLMESLGLKDSVDFLGYVPDERLQELYGRCLALVQASRYEGFGLPIIEAMACGCPVIAARNSGMIEAGGDAALFFETGDVAAMTALMEKLAGDHALVEACAAKGRAHAAGFTWEKAAQATAEIYALAWDSPERTEAEAPAGARERQSRVK